MKKLLTFFVALIASISLMAQVTTSSISGKITDSNKRTLPGATVVATHTPSGSQYYAVADANGAYRLLNIRPGGPYTIEVRMVGFQTVKQEGITATLGETKILNVRLKEESVGLGEVSVVAEAISNGMDSDRAGATTAINNEQITTLPTINRSLNDVLALTPQAAATSNGLAIGGGNYRSSYVTVDGAAFNNAFGIGGNLPAGGSPISLDAIEAMTINITPFDVRHSGFTGGAINAVTKSGTNDWHASVYDYFSNDLLMGYRYGKKDDQGFYPDRLKLNRSLDNTAGFSVGGPIVKDKLFFFVNFEYQSDIDPGQSHIASTDNNWDAANHGQTNRPTVADMEMMSNYLQTKYGYNPGRYQNYSVSTPDLKLLGRLDWNISDKDKFNIRYSLVKNKYSSSPSSSISPLSSSVYDRNNYGRTSDYAMYFESSRYYQEQNFSSVAAEWNHSFLSGRGNNMLRATYSHQYEPRSYEGNLFPTVDILKTYYNGPSDTIGTPAVYTSFGVDPFTYGNLRDVQTAIVTDELTLATGIHNLTFGAQYEFDNTKNGYMQGGAGYYVYNTWNDFVNGANPRAFAITYGNNEKHNQVYPSFNYMQGSLYAQDELNLSENFKLTAGLRVELPYYPSIAEYNTNSEFVNGWDKMVYTYDSLNNPIDSTLVHHAIADDSTHTMYGMSTADMPKARVNFSPRLGFNWDIVGNRKYILRGGTGLYTGRLPFVWIVSTVGNSNVLQNQYIGYNESIGFYDNVNDIIANYSTKLKTGDLPAPKSTTIMDKNLLMPQTWKSSLAFDAELPGGIKATIEGVYSKDIKSVAVTKLGLVPGDSLQLPGEPGKRLYWVSEGVTNSLGKAVTPYLITNSKNNGYYYSITAQLSKNFKCGLNLMAAYTYSEGKNVIDGIGDQVTSAFNTNTFGIHGSNAHELGYSSYVSPHRVLFNAGWTWTTGKHTTETVGLYYEGLNLCYIGDYSYSRFSYTEFVQSGSYQNSLNGDQGAHSLMYIPTESELSNMPFISEENKSDFNNYINSDKYLSIHRGGYAERGGAIAPWRHTINCKYERTYKFEAGPSISFGVDVRNIANLLNRSWGNVQRLSTSSILRVNGNGSESNPYTYQFMNPTWAPYASMYSTWSAALNLRFNF
jgi:hypothetical protein